MKNSPEAGPSNALAQRDIYIDHYKIAFVQGAIGEMKAEFTNQDICVALPAMLCFRKL